MRLSTKKPKYLILIISLFALALIITVSGLTINLTSSMKIGLYVRQNGEIEKGDVVLVCLPEPYKTIGLQRHYIAKGSKCDGAEPLVKEVVAIPSDKVILADQYLEINGIKYPYQTSHYDSQNRYLSVYPCGEYQRGYWLIGTNDKRSWDSRYFGAVDRKQIIEKLKPLLVF